jgi:UDP-3-O-[3-hydroxymyristoyl] N-acetylglucosamine deacetylase
MDTLVNNTLTVSEIECERTSFQTTLKSAISCTGVGLHSGNKVVMTLNPAEENSGIVFKRTDIECNNDLIRATWDRVVDTTMCTVLGNEDGVTISTIEHLMSALSGCGIDNALIEVSSAEVPIMDGSAAPFVFLIECAGIIQQNVRRRVIRVLKPITVKDGDTVVTLKPSGAFSLNVSIEFDSTVVGSQELSIGQINETFKNEVARARTFGFLHEVEQLRAAGLGKGGSLENVVVISGNKILNEEGLRFNNEFVRHKILDAIGDLYLAGGEILGKFSGVCSGHTANNQILRALFADKDAWCYELAGQGAEFEASFFTNILGRTAGNVRAVAV